MATLRCTKKLLDKLGLSVKALPQAHASANAPGQNNVLGDWYATYLPARPKHLILAVNEKSRLAVLFPSAPLKTLAPRFLAAVRQRLTALALTSEVIEAELAAMEPLAFGSTQSRSVLATMNQFVQSIDYYAEDNTLEGIAQHLGDGILGPLEWKTPHAVARFLLDPVMVEQESRVVYQLKVILVESDPPIWRRLLVPSGYTLCQLHGAIQVVMGWQNYHLHSFEIQGVEYGDDPEKELGFQDDRGVTLLRALPSVESTFEYVYDFGDHWVHEVVVEKQIAASEVVAVPICLEGELACPPEDCGGMWRYQEILRILFDPTTLDEDEAEELQGWLEWAGEDFNPAHYDLELANRRLRLLR